MMRRIAWFLGVLCLVGSSPSSAREFVYERLWPAIQQPWHFTGTRGVAVSEDDRVFVVDSFNHRIHRYSSIGSTTALSK